MSDYSNYKERAQRDFDDWVYSHSRNNAVVSADTLRKQAYEQLMPSLIDKYARLYEQQMQREHEGAIKNYGTAARHHQVAQHHYQPIINQQQHALQQSVAFPQVMNMLSQAREEGGQQMMPIPVGKPKDLIMDVLKYFNPKKFSPYEYYEEEEE